jgi:acyl-CoA thioesterase II
MPVESSEFPPLLQLKQVGEHSYEGPPEKEADAARNVVFGGQILAQSIIASYLDRSLTATESKEVKSIHAIFARAGDYSEPISYQVERMHDGRTLGSDTVTFAQNGRIMARALILWSRDEPDLFTHTEFVSMPTVLAPEDPRNRTDWRVFPGSECWVVGGVDPTDPAQPLVPPALNAWTRYTGDFAVPVNQAILSWATDGFLIGTAMLPHAGIDESQAHRTLSTGVVSHTLEFHDRFRADEWLLLANESVWAGRGRTAGRCSIWTQSGRLVAQYTQTSLIRAFADGRDHTADAARIM